jgi:predicted small metal-binding protein
MASRPGPEERLTRSFRCSDTGVVCRAHITGDTEDEVLQKAVEHAKKKHGVDLTVSTTLANYAKSAIRDEGSAPPAAKKV